MALLLELLRKRKRKRLRRKERGFVLMAHSLTTSTLFSVCPP